MTTNYTATVEITTPSAVLTDFTAVVPAALGVNVFGAATDADINTFDIGPTGDSNILLQTLAAGNHHVHDGVCHDSHTPSGPTYGVHGIYDKANGTLVEQMEFHHHPNGQGYSPRYANACYQSVFHDTPFSIGLFNYQGAAVGAGGSLRIRDCVFYNVPSGGYVFYSDGLWLESNGALLGDSLISVEIDHCTIDIRGVTNPFDFSQCHNDVYLTNCVIISDSGLPLSSIITPPLDSSVVHLDGSIVLDSADAATYLGPAPTFTPIAVGGSPVIGTAVASPPGVYALWGNAGDLGATQTGSTPPGPPPLPGPAIPSITSFDIGNATATATDTLVIPITVDVPRSDPSLGATIIVVTVIAADNVIEPDTLSVADDGATDPFYGTCFMDSGLNPYGIAGFLNQLVNDGGYTYQPLVAYFGLVLNPLDASNSITITMAGTVAWVFASARAYTGVQLDTSAVTGGFPTDDTSWFFDGSISGIIDFFGSCENNDASDSSLGLEWDYNGGGVSLRFLTPSTPMTDGDWSWTSGDIAVYSLYSYGGSSGPWSWSDSDIVTQDEFDDLDAGHSVLQTTLLAEQPITVPQSGILIDGAWGTALSKANTLGGAFALISGVGPTCPFTPPTGGNPIFNNHIRLSE